jgi:DnaJ-domain-containing protein 1
MSIQEEIAATKAAAAARLRSLNERARRAQQTVDARVLVLLRKQHPEAAAKLDAQAREQLAAETAARSTRARATRRQKTGADAGQGVAAQGDSAGYDARLGS